MLIADAPSAGDCVYISTYIYIDILTVVISNYLYVLLV